MNIRKPIDYSAMFAVLDTLMAAALPQMDLYCEIGKLISSRPEKGAAVAAAEYLCNAYPNSSGFSPRNLRRMRDFYHTYESDQDVLAEAMTIGWTQNVVILEAELTVQERMWYIRAVSRFKWSKLELQKMIVASTHMEISLDNTDSVCYTEEKVEAEEISGYVETKDSQCHGTGSSDSADGLPVVLCLLCSQFLNQRIHPKPLLVCGGSGWPIGMADGGGAPGHGGPMARFSPRKQDGSAKSGIRILPIIGEWVRLRLPLRRWFGKLPGEMHHGCTSSRRVNAVQEFEKAGWFRRRWPENLRYDNDHSANADLRYSA